MPSSSQLFDTFEDRRIKSKFRKVHYSVYCMNESNHYPKVCVTMCICSCDFRHILSPVGFFLFALFVQNSTFVSLLLVYLSTRLGLHVTNRKIVWLASTIDMRSNILFVDQIACHMHHSRTTFITNMKMFIS